MYLWNVCFEEQWTYSDGNWEEGMDWTVVAKNSEIAISKATKLALSKTRNFKDDETGVVYSVLDVRLIKLERKEEIDG